MNDCDYALVLDDDEFVLHPQEIQEILKQHGDKDVIDVTCGMGIDEYGNISDTWKFTRLMKQHVRWVNPRHNIPDSEHIKSSIVWKGDLIVVDDKNIKKVDKRTARSKQRESNISEFRKKIDANPNDTRSLFYLAVAYREAARYWEAIHWYKQYLNTGGWDEERWQANYDLAVCQLNLRRYTEAKESLYAAIKEKFDRAEAFVFMGDIWYDCNDFHNAMLWYELGCALPYPDDARLFVQRNIYEWERYDKLSMAYSHLENYSKASENAKKALIKRPNDKRIINNISVWEGLLK
jgi:tetratricopeptide (TPR) repeat protein